MNTDKDTLFEQTEAQRNPYLARPEDFEVMSPVEAAQRSLPGHGQCGNNFHQYNQLLKEREHVAGKSKPTGKGAPVVTSTDDARDPHTRGF